MVYSVRARAAGATAATFALLLCASAMAQDQQPWSSGDQRFQQREDYYRQASPQGDAYSPSRNDAYAPRGQATQDSYAPRSDAYAPSRAPANDAYAPRGTQPYNDAYSPPRTGATTAQGGYGQGYQAPPHYDGQYADYNRPPPPQSGYGQPYAPPPAPYDRGYGPRDYDGRYGPPPGYRDEERGTYSSNEILDVGHGFFGSVSQGLAKAIEYAFKKQGRPNGYILGQDAGGAIVAGLRYGEGMLYTKDAGIHRVYWQGPSIGYDWGAEGSKVMVLVYNLHDPGDIYQRFPGVAGSAYVVGGVGVTFQTNDDIVLAPIRAGVGLRIGANVGYLKYTRRPTWNPF
ncbi:MAG: DUF1134 domain-containing protein [Hyphomicrobiaceae bacterium]